MESEEVLENMSGTEETKEEQMMEEDAGGEEPIPLLHKEEEEEEKEEDVLPTELNTSKDEEVDVTAPPSLEKSTEEAVSSEETVLVHPTPQHAALTNPFLKSVLDEMPPSPRHSSPLQLALEQIHSSKVDDPPLTSPTERKEEGVQLPTKVCDFPVVAADVTKNLETAENDPETQVVDDVSKQEVGDQSPQADEHEQTNPDSTSDVNEAEEPTEDHGSSPEDVEQKPAMEETVEPKSESPQDDEDEFVVVSQEEAPVELAEEYSTETIETTPPAEEEVNEDPATEAEIWDPTESALMETAGVGLGGTVTHTLLEEKESHNPVVKVHEISKPDSFAPSESSNAEEIAHEPDPLTEPEELPETDHSSPLPTTEETPNEPGILESEEEVHQGIDPKPLTKPPTEPVPEDNATTAPEEDVAPAGDIENDAARVEPDTEVNKEMTLPEETVETQDIMHEVPTVADNIESPFHETHINETPAPIQDLDETQELANPTETLEHTERDIVDETPDESAPEVPVIATREETEVDTATFQIPDKSTKSTEEDVPVEETSIEPFPEVPSIEKHEETEEYPQELVDENPDEPMAEVEETEDKPLENSPVEIQSTEELQEPDLAEVPAPAERENVEESHIHDVTHLEDLPAEEMQGSDLFDEPQNEFTAEFPAIADQEIREDDNHDIPDPAPQPTEVSKEPEELGAFSAVPVIDSITDDPSPPPSDETTPGDIEEIEHSAPTVDSASEQQVETNVEPVPELAPVVEERSVEGSSPIEGVDHPEPPATDSAVPTEVDHPPNELPENPIDDVSEQPITAAEELSSKDHIEEEHEDVDPANEALVAETAIEEPGETLGVDDAVPEPMTAENQEIQGDAETEPAKQDTKCPVQEPVEESPHDSIPVAAEVVGIAGIAVAGTTEIAEHEHDHVSVDETLHPKPAEPIVEEDAVEHADAPVDESVRKKERVQEQSDLLDEDERNEALKWTRDMGCETGENIEDVVAPAEEPLQTSHDEPTETDQITNDTVVETERVDTPTDAKILEAPEPAESKEVVGDATEEHQVVPVDESLGISDPERKETAVDTIGDGRSAELLQTIHLEASEQGEELDRKSIGASDHEVEQQVERKKEESVEDFSKDQEIVSLQEREIEHVDKHIHEPVETAVDGPPGVEDEEQIDPTPTESVDEPAAKIDEPESAPVMEQVEEPLDEPAHEHEHKAVEAPLEPGAIAISDPSTNDQVVEEHLEDPVDDPHVESLPAPPSAHDETEAGIALAGAAVAGTSAIVLSDHYVDQQDHPPPYELHPANEGQITEANDKTIEEEVVEPVSQVKEPVETLANDLGTKSEPASQDLTDAHEHHQVQESLVEDVPPVPEDDQHEKVDDVDEHKHISVQDQSSLEQHSEITGESAVDAPVEETGEFVHEILDEPNVEESPEPLDDPEEIPLAPGPSDMEHQSVELVPQPDEMQEESAKDVEEVPLENSVEQVETHREIQEEHHLIGETAPTIDNVDSPQVSHEGIEFDSGESQAVDDESQSQLTEETPIFERAATPLVEDVEQQPTEATYDAQEVTVEIEPDKVVQDEAKEETSLEQAESGQDIGPQAVGIDYSNEILNQEQHDELVEPGESHQTYVPFDLETELQSKQAPATPVETRSDDKEYVTITPAETNTPGTVAPPPTPHMSRESPHSPFHSGMIGASVEALRAQEVQEPISREGYLDRDIVEEDDTITPAADLSVEDQTDGVEVVPLLDLVNAPDASQHESPADMTVQSKEPELASPPDESPVAKRSETDSHAFETAAALGIPVVVAAGSIGIMATATHSRGQSPLKKPHESPPISTEPGVDEDPVPAIHVDTASPQPKDILEVHGPFIEPLKHHIQPDDISPVVSDTTALRSPHLPIPFEPTHLPPLRDLTRPSTSYSWLGALFGPISPEIVEAQRTGWVVISNEIIDEPQVRRRSTKLRRRTREIFVREEEAEIRGCGIM